MPARASATPGAGAGTRCACSPPPGTPGSRACASRRRGGRSRRRTRWAATSRPTRTGSACPFAPMSASIGCRVTATGISWNARTAPASTPTECGRRLRRPPHAKGAAVRRRPRPGIVQLHSSEYRNPAQLEDGGVLVVGVGNSGAEIAFELSRSHPVVLSGKESGQIPVRHGSLPSRFVVRVMRFLGSHVLTKRTPIGRRVGPKAAADATPLIRVKTEGARRAGRRARRQGRRRAGRPAAARGRPRARRGERRLVHRLRARLLVARRSRARRDRRSPCTSVASPRRRPGSTSPASSSSSRRSSDVLPGIGRDAGYVAKHIARQAAKGGRPVRLPEPTRRHAWPSPELSRSTE